MQEKSPHIIHVGPLKISPPVLLAPMAGITDVPFRDMVCRFGAGLVVSEMVASHALKGARPDARMRAMLGSDPARTAVQIAGNEAHWMAEAARIIEGGGAHLIDINMGCPAKKVTNGYSGSALMRDPDHALRLIEAVVQATRLPVTLKMRLGWDENSLNAAQIALRAQAAGVKMVTVHARTRCQFYKGNANWALVAQIAEKCAIPVVVNGDIVCPQTAMRAKKQAQASGVMVGRGAMGRPWLLTQIAAGIAGNTTSQPINLGDIARHHYQDMLSFYGIEMGVKMARKHLNAYMNNFNIHHDARKRMLTQSDPAKVEADIRAIFPTNLEQAALKVAA